MEGVVPSGWEEGERKDFPPAKKKKGRKGFSVGKKGSSTPTTRG